MKSYNFFFCLEYEVFMSRNLIGVALFESDRVAGNIQRLQFPTTHKAGTARKKCRFAESSEILISIDQKMDIDMQRDLLVDSLFIHRINHKL